MSIESNIIAPLIKLVNVRARANQWLTCAEMEVYVRVGSLRILPDVGPSQCVDIANVSVRKPGQGTYSSLLDKIEPIILAAGYVIYQENVIEERLRRYYERRGYTRIDKDSDWPPSFFKGEHR